jgi:hypothetical protein
MTNKPHHHHGQRPPSPPQHAPPGAAGRGLASPQAFRQTLDVLRASTRGQIDEVLRQAGHRTGGGAGGGVAEAEARRYLQSDEGKRAVRAAAERLVQEAAAAELDSPGGRARVEEVKARLVARSVADDVDAFARMCQGEVRRHVEAWMQSPAGREAVELARRTAAGREARTPRFAHRPQREGTAS